MNEDEMLQKLIDEPFEVAPDYDRGSVNTSSPHFLDKYITRRLGIRFNDVPQTQVVEFCVSEGWIQRYKRDWKGRPVMNGDE